MLRCVTAGGGKNMCGAKQKDLVGQIYKACKNVVFKTCGCLLYYSSASYLWNISDSM